MSDEDKPPAWAIDLRDTFTSGMQGLNDKVDTLSTTVDTLTHDAKDTRLRLGRLEREQDELKNRQTSNSIQVKQSSEVDMKHDAAIASLMTDVADLKTKVGQIHGAVVGVIQNPKVRFVGKVVFAAAVAYSGLHGLKVVP